MVDAVDTLFMDLELMVCARGIQAHSCACQIAEFIPKENQWIPIASLPEIPGGNPDFAAVKVRYFFEKTQNFSFTYLCGGQVCGRFETSLGRIMGSPN